MRQKNLIDIYILEILRDYSSKSHRLNQSDIIRYLDENYNMSVSRNTLSGYLAEMRERGYIAGERGMYFVRKFTPIEIKMLIDSIVYSSAIPTKEAQAIAAKLKDLSEPKARSSLRNLYFIDEEKHTDNRNISRIIETIDTAIEKRRKIEITGCNYDIEGRLAERGKRIVSPYYIVTEKSRFYLLCHSGRDDVEPRRIDRISRVKILNEKRLEIGQIEKYKNYAFNIVEYMREHIYMYSGDNERIVLKVKEENIGDVVDWYGKKYKVMGTEDGYAVIKIKANVNAVYFWALQYWKIAEILEPVHLRERIREGAKDIYEKYQ